jgi:hypothetical protein
MDDAWKMPSGVPPHEASSNIQEEEKPHGRAVHAIFYGIGEERTALIQQCQASESIHEST